MPKKEVDVIERDGTKTVAKKTSFITWTKRGFAIFSVIWVIFIAWFPLHVKNTYSQPIKKSIVVSMFFDLQRNVVEQYEKLLGGIKGAINLEKPISVAIDGVKMAEGAVKTVSDTTEKAKETTTKAKKVTGLAAKFGLKSKDVDDVVNTADKITTSADNTAKMVNQKLDNIEKQLTKTMQLEVDKLIDAAIKNQIDKNAGGLGTTLLTNYGIKHIYPWRPSSWGVATKIYNDLEKSDIGTITIITDTVNKYFGYVAWGLVIAFWAIGALLWFIAFKKTKAMLDPFLVCPRCGHTFADKRTAMGLLKVFQPWNWF